MIKKALLCSLLFLIVGGCAPAARSAGLGEVPTVDVPLDPSPVAEVSPVPTVVSHVRHEATALPPEINPLTGLPAADPALLERRPVMVKVQNVPRESRPQWGLSLADLVFEYYIEYGDTRFAAVYYGQDSALVGPVRSARHVDMQLVEMYQSFLIFGGAYEELYEQMVDSAFGDRLIREGPNTAAALQRYDPNGMNYLLADTRGVQEVVALYGMDNSRPILPGMHFAAQPPAGGETGQDVYVRFSGGMYSHWQYEPDSGKYIRFSDAENDVDRNDPVYALQTDRLTEAPIAVENVVIVLAPYVELVQESETTAGVYDVDLRGQGEAFLARDGMIVPVFWEWEEGRNVLNLVDAQGQPVPFKPGQTWFELLGKSSTVEADQGAWQFTFLRP